MADLAVTVEEAAVNAVIGYLEHHLPFLFNYASPTVKPALSDAGVMTGWEEEWLSCRDVAFSPLPGLPRFRRLPPMTLPGIPLKMPYCVQVTELTLDFHPGDTVQLPPELQPPLPPQKFALALGIAFGFACIPEDLVSALANTQLRAVDRRPPVLPVTSLQCSELRVVSVGRLETTRETRPDGTVEDSVRLAVDGIEIVDIHPQGLENALECYVRAVLMGWVLPHLVLALRPFALGVLQISAVHSTFSDPPPNPSIGDDALRVGLDLTLT